MTLSLASLAASIWLRLIDMTFAPACASPGDERESVWRREPVGGITFSYQTISVRRVGDADSLANSKVASFRCVNLPAVVSGARFAFLPFLQSLPSKSTHFERAASIHSTIPVGRYLTPILCANPEGLCDLPRWILSAC
jgi:hypothetical protein